METSKPKHAYLITYDLIQEKDYKRLIEELKRWECRSSGLLSAWVLPATDRTADLTADTVLEHFRKFIDDDDKLIVVGIASYAA